MASRSGRKHEAKKYCKLHKICYMSIEIRRGFE